MSGEVGLGGKPLHPSCRVLSTHMKMKTTQSVVVLLLLLLLVETAWASSSSTFVGMQLAQQQLQATSLSGYALASSGSTVAVGVPLCAWAIPTAQAVSTALPMPGGYTGNGLVAMYECPTAKSCVFQASIPAPMATYGSAFTQSCFGLSVALANNGQFLAVGAPMYSNSNQQGAVVFYNCATVTACTPLSMTAGNDLDMFGTQVALSMVSGDVYAVAASPNRYVEPVINDLKLGGNFGAYTAFYFASPTSTSPAVSSSDFNANNEGLYTGYSMAMAPGLPIFAASVSYYNVLSALGNLPLLGSLLSSLLSVINNNPGAMLYTCTTSPSFQCSYNNVRVVVSSSDTFSYISVALSSSYLAVGAFQANSGAGSVYVYSCSLSIQSSSCSSSPIAILTGSGATDAAFGIQVSAVGAYVAAGEPNQCDAYIFSCSSSSCSLLGLMTGGTGSTSFGDGLAINPELQYVLVGSPASAFCNPSSAPFSCPSTVSATESSTESLTAVLSFAHSATASATGTSTATASATSTWSATASATSTWSATASATSTSSATASATSSSSATASSAMAADTESAAVSVTASASALASFSESVTATVLTTPFATVAPDVETATTIPLEAAEMVTTAIATTFADVATAGFVDHEWIPATSTVLLLAMTPTPTPGPTFLQFASATSNVPTAYSTALVVSVYSTASTDMFTTALEPTPAPSSTILYFNPNMPATDGHTPEIFVYMPTSSSKRDSTYQFVTAVKLISCGTPGFFAGQLILPDSVTAAVVPYLGMSFVSVDSSDAIVYTDGASCKASTPNNYYIGISNAPVTLVFSPGGCAGEVILNFDGEYEGMLVKCLPFFNLGIDPSATPTPTPSVSGDGGGPLDWLIWLIIALLLLLLLCCLLLLIIYCANYRRKMRKLRQGTPSPPQIIIFSPENPHESLESVHTPFPVNANATTPECAVPIELANAAAETTPRTSYETFVIHDEIANGNMRARAYWFSVFNGGADDPDESDDTAMEEEEDDDVQMQPLSSGGESSTLSKFTYMRTPPPAFDESGDDPDVRQQQLLQQLFENERQRDEFLAIGLGDDQNEADRVLDEFLNNRESETSSFGGTFRRLFRASSSSAAGAWTSSSAFLAPLPPSKTDTLKGNPPILEAGSSSRFLAPPSEQSSTLGRSAPFLSPPTGRMNGKSSTLRATPFTETPSSTPLAIPFGTPSDNHLGSPSSLSAADKAPPPPRASTESESSTTWNSLFRMANPISSSSPSDASSSSLSGFSSFFFLPRSTPVIDPAPAAATEMTSSNQNKPGRLRMTLLRKKYDQPTPMSFMARLAGQNNNKPVAKPASHFSSVVSTPLNNSTRLTAPSLQNEENSPV